MVYFWGLMYKAHMRLIIQYLAATPLTCILHIWSKTASHFADPIFNDTFMYANCWIFITISLEFVRNDLIENIRNPMGSIMQYDFLSRRSVMISHHGEIISHRVEIVFYFTAVIYHIAFATFYLTAARWIILWHPWAFVIRSLPFFFKIGDKPFLKPITVNFTHKKCD